MEGLYKKIMKGSYPKIPSKYSADLSAMIKSLLQTDPRMRPNCCKISYYVETILKMANVKEKDMVK
jgi:NIMA (never in mitosis gene a)-related kinase